MAFGKKSDHSVIQMFPDPSTVRSDVAKTPIKWEYCVVCHVRKINCLWPAKGNVQTAGTGYYNFTKNVERFLKISSWPVDIDPDQLDDGEGIVVREPADVYITSCVQKVWVVGCVNRLLQIPQWWFLSFLLRAFGRGVRPKWPLKMV